MKNFLPLSFGMFTLLILLSPTSTHAYFTSEQTAALYSPTTAIYTITYRFGFLNREAYLPIATERDLAFGTTSDDLGYTLLTRAGSSTPVGSLTGLVVSNATIKDGMYYLPKGKAADFTLIAVLTVPAGENAADYALQVSSLPFYMVDNGTKIKARLNPSELQYYTTPRAKLSVTQKSTNPNVTVTGVTYTLSSKNGQ